MTVLAVAAPFVESRKIDAATLIDGAGPNGTIPLCNWIGDEGATTFSY